MKRDERVLYGLFIAAFILSLLGLLYSIVPVRAQDAAPTICRDPEIPTQFVFHVPAAWNDPDIGSWSVLASALSEIDSTTFRADPITQVETYGEGYPDWQYKIKVGQVVIFSADYSLIVFADDQTPLCDARGYPAATDTPVPAQNSANANVVGNQVVSEPVPTSSAATCVIKYPQIILVCNR